MNTGVADIAERARRAADAATGFDARQYLSVHGDLTVFGLRAMARVLGPALSDDEPRTEEHIAAQVRASPRHRWLLRRWLTELTAHGWLTDEGPRGYRSLRENTAPVCADLAEVCAELGFSPQLAAFFERADSRLSALLRDRVLPQELLFPDGDFRTAEAAYRDNPVNRYLNAATREITAWAVQQVSTGRAPVRILELGGGVGGTTSDIVAALAESDHLAVDYLFTDVSKFFLDAAREQFGRYRWMRYGMVDLNADLPRQPRCDVVVAANVLHNAHHCGRTLRAVREILRPGGYLIFVESCREHAQLLTSMHFLMSARPGHTQPGRTDVRAGTDRIFLTEQQWREQLAAAGLEPVLELPDSTHPLAVHGQRLFAARNTGQRNG